MKQIDEPGQMYSQPEVPLVESSWQQIKAALDRLVSNVSKIVQTVQQLTAENEALRRKVAILEGRLTYLQGKS